VLVNNPVLVLNQSYEPLNICHAKRALALIMAGRAEMLEDGMGYIHTSRSAYAIPSVIKLDYIIRRPRAERKLTRVGVFHRDNFTCQYCGKDNQLTIDHVIPRFQSGRHTWENVVAACVPCNRRKAGRTPEQANMKLKRQPVKPRDSYAFYLPHRYLGHLDKWSKYLPQYFTS
jgi:5-methylcytosine-specific restriction endonuclease McrA